MVQKSNRNIIETEGKSIPLIKFCKINFISQIYNLKFYQPNTYENFNNSTRYVFHNQQYLILKI